MVERPQPMHSAAVRCGAMGSHSITGTLLGKCFFAMRVLGQVLQRLGLFIPPLAIVLQLLNAISLRDMLVALVASVSAFWLGRLIEGYAIS